MLQSNALSKKKPYSLIKAIQQRNNDSTFTHISWYQTNISCQLKITNTFVKHETTNSHRVTKLTSVQIYKLYWQQSRNKASKIFCIEKKLKVSQIFSQRNYPPILTDTILLNYREMAKLYKKEIQFTSCILKPPSAMHCSVWTSTIVCTELQLLYSIVFIQLNWIN